MTETMNSILNLGDLKSVISEKKPDILLKVQDEFQNTEKFKCFYAALCSYLKKSALGSLKTIIITKDVLNSLKEEYSYYEELKKSLDSDCFAHNSFIQLNLSFGISAFSFERRPVDNNDARDYYIELSKKFVVFILYPDCKIHYFIDGKDYGGGIFFREEDRRAHQEKKPITEIDKVFSAYRLHLKSQNVYCKFFMPKCSVVGFCDAVHNNRRTRSSKDKREIGNFLKSNSHILVNKPENRFRDDLMDFLRKNLRISSIDKENLLSNFDRLDINIKDEEGFARYFVEVKWIGQSASDSGKLNGTTYRVSRIVPEAIEQTIRYLKHLYEVGEDIRLGYLAVFDARKDVEFTGADLGEYEYSESDSGAKLEEFSKSLSEEDQKHFPKLRKIRDFRVENTHPC